MQQCSILGVSGVFFFLACLGLGCGSDPVSADDSQRTVPGEDGGTANADAATGSDEIPLGMEEDSSLEGIPPDPETDDGIGGATSYVWPMPGCKNITSKFLDKTRQDKHYGIDVTCNNRSLTLGHTVVAAAEGTVQAIGTYRGTMPYPNCTPVGSGGLLVQIRHPDGTLTRYLHNSSVLVKKGDTVKAGQEIAKAGTSGCSTGPHLHFDIMRGKTYVDPEKFVEPTDNAAGSSQSGCKTQFLYCGGNVVAGDRDTLYSCTGGTSGVVQERCAYGCEIHDSGESDRCITAGPTVPSTDKYPCGSSFSRMGKTVQTCSLTQNGVPVFADTGGSQSRIGILNKAGGNWFVCQKKGSPHTLGGATNDWWAKTYSDDGKWGWVPETYFKGGANNEKDAGLRECQSGE